MHQFDFENDVPATWSISTQIDADNPDLSGFRKRDGKLIMGVGWSDWAVNALALKNYYDRVIARAGSLAATQACARLFLLPGIGHGFAADPTRKTPNHIDLLSALKRWVEAGIAPNSIVATHVAGQSVPEMIGPSNRALAGEAVDRARPICAYPKIATYRGAGSIDK